MALLPLRPLLLRQYPQLHLLVDSTWITGVICCLLLPLAWFIGDRGSSMEKFSRLP